MFSDEITQCIYFAPLDIEPRTSVWHTETGWTVFPAAAASPRGTVLEYSRRLDIPGMELLWLIAREGRPSFWVESQQVQGRGIRPVRTLEWFLDAEDPEPLHAENLKVMFGDRNTIIISQGASSWKTDFSEKNRYRRMILSLRVQGFLLHAWELDDCSLVSSSNHKNQTSLRFRGFTSLEYKPPRPDISIESVHDSQTKVRFEFPYNFGADEQYAVEYIHIFANDIVERALFCIEEDPRQLFLTMAKNYTRT